MECDLCEREIEPGKETRDADGDPLCKGCYRALSEEYEALGEGERTLHGQHDGD